MCSYLNQSCATSETWTFIQCATCPDVSNCARLFDEKWRQAYNACFRFGPCQPSMVYRYLRSLEGISPPLALTQTSCQNTAKAFAATCKVSIYPNIYGLTIFTSSVWSNVFSWCARKWNGYYTDSTTYSRSSARPATSVPVLFPQVVSSYLFWRYLNIFLSLAIFCASCIKFLVKYHIVKVL